MPSIPVCEPALCCSIGVSGFDVDQDLVTFGADLDYLTSRGADTTRHNLANDPEAFVGNPVVLTFLQTVGTEGLPLTLVDDVTVATGRHLDRDTLARLAGRTTRGDLGLVVAPHTSTSAAGCCSGEGCC